MQRSLACRPWCNSQVGVAAAAASAAGTCQLRPRPIALSSNQYRQPAKFTLATLGASGPRVKSDRASFRACVALAPVIRFSRSYKSGQAKKSKASKGSTPVTQPGASTSKLVDSNIHLANRIRDKIFATCADGPATEEQVLLAFAACGRAASSSATTAFAAAPAAVPRPNTASESETTASSLLDLDGPGAELTQRSAPKVSETSMPSKLTNHVSKVAFEIFSHPNVVSTPKVLEAYVDLQVSLGKLESIPHVLGLYPSKSRSNGILSSNVPERSVVEKALDAAIEARNLDAAIGVIESTYATSAFRKQKILKKSLLPVSLAVVCPWAIHLVASQLAHFQTSYTHETATTMATVGILTYVCFTGSFGLLAVLTHNDHMKRVTWVSGVPLTERYIREEERAALDKVACAFGFSQETRWGEEKGPEFEALREFIRLKGMILDRTELMKSMS